MARRTLVIALLLATVLMATVSAAPFRWRPPIGPGCNIAACESRCKWGLDQMLPNRRLCGVRNLYWSCKGGTCQCSACYNGYNPFCDYWC
jgi:hypothetical protein